MSEQAPDYSEFTPDKTGDEKLVKQELEKAARELLNRATEVEEAEAVLKTKKASYKDMAENIIPELMDKLGKKRFVTSTGLVIGLKEGIRASIPELAQGAAFDWMRANGHAGLIKREMKLGFGMGDDERAETVKDKLRELGMEVDVKTYVHPATLNSFVKEQLEQDHKLPEECFSYVQIREAKVG